jgi:FAD/FMN-containing dehydrogenase
MTAMGESGAYIELLQNIKQTLDPGGVLAPGRYLPAGAANRLSI